MEHPKHNPGEPEFGEHADDAPHNPGEPEFGGDEPGPPAAGDEALERVAGEQPHDAAREGA